MVEAVLIGILTLAQWQDLTTPPDPTPLPAIALRIASCESGDGQGSYSLTAKNPRSSASGKYQFIDSTWEWVTGRRPPASAWPEEVQDEAFIALWNQGEGAHHWAPSRYCWG